MKTGIEGYILLLGIFLFGTVSGQTNPDYDAYFKNAITINPASAGSENYPVLGLSYRKQWLNVPQSPGTQLFWGSIRVGRYDFYTPRLLINKSGYKTKERIGLGLSVYNDQNGPLSKSGVQLAYSYHIPVEYDHLSFGISASMSQYIIDQSDFDPLDPGDPEISGETERLFIPNANIGGMFYSQNIFFGISVMELFKAKKIIQNRIAEVQPDVFINIGYKQRINKILDLEPSLLLNKINTQPYGINLHAKLYFYQYHWIALSSYSFQTVELMLALRVNQWFHVGYAFEYYTGDFSRAYNGAHSFMIGRNIGLRFVEGLRKVNR